MTRPANAMRGEAELAIEGRIHLLRPSFDALVRAEEELGSLFALAERAGAGELRLAEMTALLWHCLDSHEGTSREAVGRAVVEMGIAAAARPLRVLLGQIFRGAG